MALNSTAFPNISRIVAGSAILFPNDGILLCDTSIAPVSMTLLEIPANSWQTTWKLYVLDNSNNAATRNITISAPVGYTINGASSIVINVNGGGCVITITSNTTFLGQLNYSTGGGGGVSSVTASSPMTSSGGANPNISIPQATTLADGYLDSADWTTFNNKSEIVAASNTAGSVVAACTDFKFDTTYFDVTNPSGSVAGISTADSGWLDLLGFEFIPAGSRPQYRVIGKMVVFRGNAVVPLANNPAGSSLIPMTVSGAGSYYVNDAFAYTFTGASPSNGCSAINDGAIVFNRQLNVFQTPLLLDNTYTTGIKICTRTVKVSGVGTGVNLSTAFSVFIVPSVAPNPLGVSRLLVATYKDNEISQAIPDTLGNGLGLGTLRPIVANVKSGQYAPNYSTMRTEYVFTVTASDAIQGATYTTPNGATFTVVQNINNATTLICVGTGAPTAAPSTLTLSSIAVTGDATIAYSNVVQRNSSTHSALTNLNLDVDYEISTLNRTFLFDVDSTDENLIGGFVIPLDGLVAYTV